MFFFFQAEDGIRDVAVTGVQTCALPIYWAPILQRKLATIPELRDVNSDQQLKGLQSSLVIDRDTASRLGVAVQDIDNTLGDAFGQRQVSNIYKGLNQYHVVLEVAPEMQRSPEALN